MSRNVRRTVHSDMEAVLSVFEAARQTMAASGNTTQWRNGYPSEASVLSDIEMDGSFVIVDNGQVVAYFAFLPSPEPTYSKIYDGQWTDDTKAYHVIHRIASFPQVHGIFKSIMDFCFSHEDNIRVDTHKDNRIMQHNIEKAGFVYCGIIHLANGEERLAYQKII
ncbi:MAG: acetyltransferase [Bacteroidaceae bacterium]|nr:acetyltransferase [Bacteroidaceae bacterium]